MNANRLHFARVFTFILLAWGSAANGQIPLTEFRAGAYRGTLRFITSIDGVGTTSTAMKVKGRSQGFARLEFIGTPQLAGSVVGVSDDLPVKAFRLDYEISGQNMVLWEIKNMDADGSSQGRPLSSLTVGRNMVRAETKQNRTIGVTEFEITTRITLTRVGD